MNRAPTSIFVPPIRRESQHGSGVRRTKRKRKNKKTRRKIKKKSANLVTNFLLFIINSRQITIFTIFIICSSTANMLFAGAQWPSEGKYVLF